jgi:hypothetical protein
VSWNNIGPLNGKDGVEIRVFVHENDYILIRGVGKVGQSARSITPTRKILFRVDGKKWVAFLYCSIIY